MKKYLKSAIIILFVFSLISCQKNNGQLSNLPLVPQPNKVSQKEGHFTFSVATKIQFDDSNPDAAAVAGFLNELFEQPAGFRLEKAPASNIQQNIVILNLLETEGKLGSYELKVEPEKIEITAGSAVGLFYGVQTIRQLLPPQIEKREAVSGVSWTIPCVEIKDAPRFSYRGLHLDVGRHFFPVSFIKKYIDLLALHKMNTFHWHLTEDQGWRIEITKYPKLTGIGGFRAETLLGHGGRPPFEYDGRRYGGFYTQDEIREVVAYAKMRFVTIIPEIEMPGHSSAALAAYPELGCTGGPYQVQTRWGVFNDVYCAGNDKVFEFMEDVLDEVVELFPGKYIHIGGDECPKKAWEECPKCQARIKNEGLKDEHALQSYFIRRIEKYLLTRNRYIIGWDEILEGGLAPQATVMSWRGITGGIEAARQKHDVIMTPGTHCYLDHYQADAETQPLAIGGFTTLEKIYSFEPVPDTLNAEEQKYILGAQGNVWTEYMKTSEHVEFMVYPRASALAEVLWAEKDRRDYTNFLGRMEGHYKRLKILGVNYFYQVARPVVESDKIYFLDEVVVEMQKPFADSEIRFTIDGSAPGKSSKEYKGKMKIKKTTDIKAIAIKIATGESSPVLNISVNKLEYIDPAADKPQSRGLKYNWYNGKFTGVSNLDTCQNKQDGLVDQITFPIKEASVNFGFRLKGFLKIDQKGIYDFRLISDDGSKMYLADAEFIDNDGFHGAKAVNSSAALKEGFYPIEVLYFQGGGGAKLDLQWRKEGQDYSQIPTGNLFH